MHKIIKTNNYKFLVSVRSLKNYPSCKWPRELPIKDIIRGCRTVYYKPDNTIEKQIIYPVNIWFSKIEEYDPLELDIIDIKNFWPDWYLIRVINRLKNLS
jgi:hypothetical protein